MQNYTTFIDMVEDLQNLLSQAWELSNVVLGDMEQQSDMETEQDMTAVIIEDIELIQDQLSTLRSHMEHNEGK